MYRKRQVTPEEAIGCIQSGQKVFLAPFCNEPQTLAEELVRQKNRFRHLLLYNIALGSPCLYADSACQEHFKIRTFLSSPKLKHAFIQQAADYIPVNLSEVPRWIEETKPDTALIQISPPNENGYCSLGISVDIIPELIEHAKTVIAETNCRMPVTEGDTLVHVSEIDHFVLSDRPLLTVSPGRTDRALEEIANYTAGLIPDYAAVQIGTGSISNTIVQALTNKKGLGIHTGSITDPFIELIDLGVVTNERKELNPLQSVCTTLTGTERLYEYARRNSKITLLPVSYTHNPAVIAKLSKFHAVNSALEIDLTGQINAEQLNGSIAAGVGGQMDFIHGARLSPGGRAIIALPSTAKKGTESRIKWKIPAVTSLKSEIDYVVTEYGIASLFGKTIQERAEALIQIAHPDFRESLKEEAALYRQING